MGSSVVIRGLERDYNKYRALFLSAFATLAKNGFVVPPDDALDLIHDFFISEWSGLASRFDSSKGSFEGYAYSAFVHYARPRIVKLQRFRSALVADEVLESLENPHPRSNAELASALDLARWETAIESLAATDRRLLLDYLYESRGSERSLARNMRMSRYAVRERLVRILGSIIPVFGALLEGHQKDWKVAEALWSQSRSIPETALLLDMTPEEVSGAKARVTGVIVDALARFHDKGGVHMGAAAGRSARKDKLPDVLLYETLTHPGDRALLAELKNRSAEVLEAIDARDAIMPKHVADSLDELWVAEVYEALAGGTLPELGTLADDLFRASAEDMASIGTAFKETLLPGLSIELTKFSVWFGALRQVSPDEIQVLSMHPDVEAAFPISAQIIVYGIRPSMFFFATEAVSGLVDRVIRFEAQGELSEVFLRKDEPFVLNSRQGSWSMPLDDEIAKMAECSLEMATALRRWTLAAAEYKPFLFAGFESEVAHNGIALRRTREHFPNLYSRWGLAYANI